MFAARIYMSLLGIRIGCSKDLLASIRGLRDRGLDKAIDESRVRLVSGSDSARPRYTLCLRRGHLRLCWEYEFGIPRIF